MNINLAGQALIKFYESLKLVAYFDMAGVPTIGWGHTRTVTASDVMKRKTITVEEAQALFDADVHEHALPLAKMLRREANENQFAAMVSLAFNIGVPAFLTSSVFKFHNLGNVEGVKASFKLWNKARDKRTGLLVVAGGLVARRAKEADLYSTPVLKAQP